MKLIDLHELHISYKACEVCSATIGSYREQFGYVMKFLSSRNIRYSNKLTPKLFAEYRAYEASRGICVNTINKRLGYFKTLLNFAVDIEDLPVSPLKNTRLKNSKQKPIPCQTNEEIQKLLEYLVQLPSTLANERDKLIFFLAIESGIRRSEMVSLNICDIKENHVVLHEDQTKNKDPRKIAITDIVYCQFEKYLSLLQEKHDIGENSHLFCILRGGTRMTVQALDRMTQSISKKIGFNVSLHRIRKYYATQAHANNVSIIILMTELGHKDLNMTKRYVQLDDEIFLESKNKSSMLKNYLNNSKKKK